MLLFKSDLESKDLLKSIVKGNNFFNFKLHGLFENRQCLQNYRLFRIMLLLKCVFEYHLIYTHRKFKK